MTESANTSERPGLLSARNVILAAAAVLVLSVLGSCVSMLRPPDSGGVGRDSFGTRRYGYRALVETLNELGIATSRDLAPPQADADDDHTLVILEPDELLVSFSPKYVKALLEWIDHGGRLVVTPTRSRATFFGTSVRDDDEDREHDLLRLLEISDDLAALDSSENDTDYLEELSDTYEADGQAPPRSLPVVRLTGSLQRLEPLVKQINVPGDGYATLKLKRPELRGTLMVKDKDDRKHVLVAAIERGKGEMIVVSDPRLFENVQFARADNSVLAVHLMAPEGRDVVIDEFYHGLAVRGNPLYLLTRPAFAAVAIGLLVGVGVWTWRSAVFLGPPLAPTSPSRRDIGQYIDAMSDFFARAPDHRRFIAREVRDGVLHRLCEQMKLPPDTTNVESILHALRRRDPQQAEQLGKLLQKVDHELAQPGNFPKADFLPTMQALAGSL
jgi:hypothetical protein